MKYLLDTSICIELLRQKSQSVLGRVQIEPPENMAICMMVRAELLTYYEKLRGHQEKQDREFKAINKLCQQFYLFDFDEGVARTFAQIKAHLKGQKPHQYLDSADILIAATARANNLTLVTDNIKDFEKIPYLDYENWKER